MGTCGQVPFGLRACLPPCEGRPRCCWLVDKASLRAALFPAGRGERRDCPDRSAAKRHDSEVCCIREAVRHIALVRELGRWPLARFPRGCCHRRSYSRPGRPPRPAAFASGAVPIAGQVRVRFRHWRSPDRCSHEWARTDHRGSCLRRCQPTASRAHDVLRHDGSGRACGLPWLYLGGTPFAGELGGYPAGTRSYHVHRRVPPPHFVLAAGRTVRRGMRASAS
mmetsp:Transcript_94812/g.267687  ORF Transcript_94812/g.267687 Transcript_94812/m.267687 type:complete len:223 (-) Transcript_94812:1499-2167(-)